MREWLRGSPGVFAAAFVVVCGLVAGGLGWTTAAALGLENQQQAERAEADRAQRLRLALWRLDSFMAPQLAVEDGRPFNHYTAVYAAPTAFDNHGKSFRPGSVVEPSPLLSADLPDWMLLHFQLDAAGWQSPQALSENISRVLLHPPAKASAANATRDRTDLLNELKRTLPSERLLAAARDRASPATHGDRVVLPASGRATDFVGNRLPPSSEQNLANDYGMRQQATNPGEPRAAQLYNRDVALGNLERNGENWLNFPSAPFLQAAETPVRLSPMASLWAPTDDGGERLLLVRLVRIEGKEVCQGVVLDAAALQTMLVEKVADLFPDAQLVPVHEAVPPRPERTMTALPLELDPGPAAAPPGLGWTTLRVGLVLAWAAALAALVAVGLVGRSLLDLSERRIRFVSAVTHELRTPLTTLRLYLDMLLGGMVRDESKRDSYLQTLDAETGRLSRLVGNVLDYSRLEKQRQRLKQERVAAAELVERVRAVWQGRCQDSEKELVVENELGEGAALWADGGLLQQVVGNLLDNACKYSRGAADRRVWLRLRGEGRRIAVEVEDRGPGVPAGERGSIFRAFRRGRAADSTGGGVGLGLALARRWARLLGGKLTLAPAPAEGGACFRLTLPAAGPP
jgi:signal transduction histidine kinase